ncbi:hypothetical protein [Streptomyces pactum]|nr:hypothetical protein [Streptomyces pactum]
MDHHDNAWGRFSGRCGKDVDMPRDKAGPPVPGWYVMACGDGALDCSWS